MSDLTTPNSPSRSASDAPDAAAATTTRAVARWMVTFAGFPLGGLLTDLAVGPVDSPGRAVLGGLLTGAVLGAVQAWGLGQHRPAPSRWILATAVGLTVGLLVGAASVDYGTELSDLLLLGALCGAAVGALQAVVLTPALGRRALGWPFALAGIWAIGWAVTTAAGVQVDQQFSVFGSSGALVVTALTARPPRPDQPARLPAGKERVMTRHVVFGTGQVGRLVAEQLVQHGGQVVAVNRNGRADIAGAEVIGGDATDPAFTRRAAGHADVIYFCLNAMNYARWAEEFPPLQRAVLAAAQQAGARLVVLDNLYAYGPTGGRDLVETLQSRPTSTKAAIRAAMTDELLRAHRDGQVEVAIGRASDYFGPGAANSALGDTVFGTAVTGRTAQVMGDPDQPHSYSYTPDVAAGLVTLGAHPAASGEVWHLPVAETRTTRQVIERVYQYAGHRPRMLAAGRTTLRLVGLARPAMREYLHTLYQFTDRWVVDDRKFRAAFGDLATPLDDSLATTLRWYGHRAAATQPRQAQH